MAIDYLLHYERQKRGSMKHLLYLCIALCVTNAAVADEQNPLNTLNCVNKESYSINPKCMASLIESSPAYQSKISTFFMNAATSSQSDYAVATIKFYENESKIEIIGHRDSN